MSLISDSKSKPFQGNKAKPSHSKETTPHLKLVISNLISFEEREPIKPRSFNEGFTAEIRKRGYCNYVLAAWDSFHYLDCEIPLEIHENEEEFEPMSVTCHFPNIVSEELSELVWEDETLYGIILIQFQMKVLKQILLFCTNHNALNLLIYTDDTPEGLALEIYRYFAKYEAKIPTIEGTKTQMIIPITPKIFGQWLKLADEISQDFRQMLWGNQSRNPAIRAYLKSNPCLIHSRFME